jgi:uncharacterized protein YjbI with pentapeptide repeats
MKKLALAALAVAIIATPALAQNPSQIASAKAGHNCPGCNLFQADLSNSELQHKNFAGARLRQANLSVTEMNGTNFSRTDLRDVNAYAGRFTGASFAGANLTNATFVGTFLGGADFKGATLDGANFGGAEMGGAKGLTQAQLNKACGDGSTIVPKGLHIPSCR